jgi:phosphoribosyl 1,2-cyclic phosphodiesterase
MANIKLSHPQNHIIEEETTSQTNPVEEIKVQFWGVRGLIPTPDCSTCRYGGNTACVEIQVAGKRLIFDGGTGLRILGKSLEHMQEPLEAHVFFTNSQSNRIHGFPFFAPAFISENSLHVYGTAALNGASIKQCLGDQMLQPHFPYPLQVMQSDLQFYNLMPGKEIQLGDVSIIMELINFAQRSVGYRINWQEYSIAYVTDLQKSPDETEQNNIVKLIQGVDLLIANATYNPPTRSHDSDEVFWQTAVDLARHAGVKSLAISHYHPDDNDDFLDRVQGEVKSTFPKVMLAREGLIVPVV